MNSKFKKLTSVFLAVIMVFGIFAIVPFTVGAEETINNFSYQLNENGTASITDYYGNETNLIIPSTLDGHTVTSIGYNAFSYCKSIESITIPDSVNNSCK